MNVTLDIFSGRPNPTWTLSEEQQTQLLERVSGRRLATVDSPTAVLGYRGLVVSAAQDDLEGVPQEFRIAGAPSGDEAAKVIGGRGLSVSEENEIARFLLEAGRASVGDDLQQIVTGELQRRQESALPPQPPEPLPNPPEPIPQPVPSCQILNTKYNPGFWNVPSVQPYNNCYNYAMNNRTDTYAQPGRISGHMYTSLDCANVGAAADADGCKSTCKGRVKLVALVIWPGFDFHWYRRQLEGFWAHKPGGTPVRNVDSSNRLIDGTTLTPANCNRGPYAVFCGYRYSPKGMRVK